MAPGILNNGTASNDERAFAARGLLPYLVNDTRYSMCSDGMPCREYNQFLFNGTLLALSHSCGTAKNLLDLLKQRWFYETALTGLEG
jgi:hypothetical protein